MSIFRMTAGTREIERAITACQMAFGCLVGYVGMCVTIVTFEAGDADCIVDTLQEAGSVFVRALTVEEFCHAMA